MQGRRFCLYFSWSRPKEIGAELGVLENRFPTLFEFRRAIWPLYEWAADPRSYRQDISGFLDHVILFDFRRFEAVIQEATGRPVGLIQRVDDRPPARELDETFLRDVDTLIVVSLDHFVTEQTPGPGEIQAVEHFLEREEACLVVCPHHNIGAVPDEAGRLGELRHHADRLVPPQQRIGGFARALLEGLGIPIENRYGLSPGRDPGNGEPAPLELFDDLDGPGVLRGVSTFNIHPHLPHLHVLEAAAGQVRVLARQLINPRAESHPFVEAGNRYFNAFAWVPPTGSRAGQVFVGDATLWSSAFRGVASLERLWSNLAAL